MFSFQRTKPLPSASNGTPTSSTALESYPMDPSPYVPPMQLGTGIDALTGNIAKGRAILSNAEIQELPATTPSRFTYNVYETSEALRRIHNRSWSGSITAALPLNSEVTFAHSYATSHKTALETCSRFIHIHFEQSPFRRLLVNPELSDKALKVERKDPANFRDIYGDYFVSEINYKQIFTATFKVTSEDVHIMNNFTNSLAGTVKPPVPSSSTPDIVGLDARLSLNLLDTISQAVREYKVQMEVDYTIHADFSGTPYSLTNVVSAFEEFCSSAKPVAHDVYLRHYNTVEHTISNIVNIDRSLYNDILQVFSLQRQILMLRTLLPSPPGFDEQQKRDDRVRVQGIFEEIRLKRLNYQVDPAELKRGIERLQRWLGKLRLCQERYDILLGARSYQYRDFTESLDDAVDSLDPHGVWVNTATHNVHSLGRTDFSPQQLKAHKMVTKEHRVPALDSNRVQGVRAWLSFKWRKEQDILSFSEARLVDRAEGQNGHANTHESAYSSIYVVGFEVEDCAPKRGRGRFRIRRTLQLGKAPKDMSSITVENREMRMNWRLIVYCLVGSIYPDDDDDGDHGNGEAK